MRAATTAVRMARTDAAQAERFIGEALGALALVTGGSRACLCIGGRDRRGETVRRFVSGGLSDMATLGSQLAGVAPDSVPEWDLVSGAVRPLPVLRVRDVSMRLREALAPTGASWMITTPLRTKNGQFASLSVLGRGDAADVAASASDATALVADLLTEALDHLTAARQPSEADHYHRLALDLIDEGVMILDWRGHVKLLNQAAERQIGCTFADLDASVPIWDQIDATVAGGPTLAEIATDPRAFLVRESLGPVPMRVVGRHGLVSRGDLTVRTVATLDDEHPMMLAIFDPVRTYHPIAGQRGHDEPASLASPVAPRTDGAGTDEASPRPGDSCLARAAAAGFTAREQQVLALLLEGVRVPGIARRLFLSQHTVRNQLKGMFRKAGVNSQAELVEFARAEPTHATR